MSGGIITEDLLRAAVEAVRNEAWAPDPCALGQHLVSATAMRRLRDGGTAVCYRCCAPLGPFA